MNNFSWNLDVLSHGGAHYSSHWKKSNQDAYNKWYYINVTKKKNLGDKLNALTNPITGNADQDKMDDIRTAINAEDKAQGDRHAKWANKFDDPNVSDVELNARTDAYLAQLDKYYKDRGQLIDDLDKIKQHYNTKTLEGRVKSGNTVFNKATRAVSRAIDDAAERFNGTREKRNMERSKKRYDAYKELDEYAGTYYRDKYNEAVKAYDRTPVRRIERASKAGQEMIDAILGK